MGRDGRLSRRAPFPPSGSLSFSLILVPALTLRPRQYTVEWTADETIFSLDGEVIATFTTNVPKKPMAFNWNSWSSGEPNWVRLSRSSRSVDAEAKELTPRRPRAERWAPDGRLVPSHQRDGGDVDDVAAECNARDPSDRGDKSATSRARESR